MFSCLLTNQTVDWAKDDRQLVVTVMVERGDVA